MSDTVRKGFAVSILGLAVCAAALAQSVYDLERARWAAADSVAFIEADVAPGPEPEPEPGRSCARCEGSGVIRPDGRIEIQCPDCGGDGWTSFDDLLRMIDELRSDERREPEAASQSTPTSRSVSPAPPRFFHLDVNGFFVEGRGEAEIEIGVSRIDPDLPDSRLVTLEDIEEWNRLAKNNQARLVPSEWRWDCRSPTEVMDLLKTEDRPVFIYWTADWCQPCKQFERNVLETEEMALMLSGFIKCRFDYEELGDERAKKWNVTHFPTFFIMPKGYAERTDRKLYRRHVGFDKFNSWLPLAIEWISILEKEGR